MDVQARHDVVHGALAIAEGFDDLKAIGVGQRLECLQLHDDIYVYECIYSVKRRCGRRTSSQVARPRQRVAEAPTVDVRGFSELRSGEWQRRQWDSDGARCRRASA